jgi:hypothetical protein
VRSHACTCLNSCHAQLKAVSEENMRTKEKSISFLSQAFLILTTPDHESKSSSSSTTALHHPVALGCEALPVCFPK